MDAGRDSIMRAYGKMFHRLAQLFFSLRKQGDNDLVQKLAESFQKHDIYFYDPTGEKMDDQIHDILDKEEKSSLPSGTISEINALGGIYQKFEHEKYRTLQLPQCVVVK